MWLVSRSLSLAFVVAVATTNMAWADECDGAYYAADDHYQDKPLKRPPKDFMSSYKGALAGSPIEQRNIAVSYESGYLVSKCDEKALYWYEKAAKGGDEKAQNWIDRRKVFDAMRNGPECAGIHCPAQDIYLPTTLYARNDKGNHFWAPVTINGHTVYGIIDTGASTIAMSAETAKAFGISLEGGSKGKAGTAGGVVSITKTTIPLIDVAGIKLYDVEVGVGDSKHPVLIGMAFLKHLNISISGGTLTMKKFPEYKQHSD
ncbi:hypothetical protein MASR1M60_07690 [Rhodocyclaceae bacterium]